VQGVVLSHGHYDHTGGLAGLARRLGARRLPMVVHPYAWTRRRQAVPGKEPWELPTLSPRALDGEGFTLVERREPSLLVDGCVLITGEVDRTTEFERGMPPAHQPGPSRSTGRNWQAIVMPTAAGLPVSSRTSQSWATERIHVPVAAAAKHRRAHLRRRGDDRVRPRDTGRARRRGRLLPR
jgi:metal-dependent hydrolase (beta-lactamase superfamily II)